MYKPGCVLRSSGRGLLSIPKIRLKTKRDRAFTVRAPRLLNSVPKEIRLAGFVNSFKFLLEAYFHQRASPDSPFLQSYDLSVLNLYSSGSQSGDWTPDTERGAKRCFPKNKNLELHIKPTFFSFFFFAKYLYQTF